MMHNPNKRVYVVRHGEANLLTGIAYDRVPGPPLSEKGQKQALQAAEYLAHAEADVLFASPLVRALNTAQVISQQLGLLISVTEDLREAQNGELREGIRDRIRHFWEAQVLDSPARVIVCVSHGLPIEVLLESTLPMPMPSNLRRFDYNNIISTGGIWRLNQQPDGSWEGKLVHVPVEYV
ncbi:MAG: histidine phosphatase family protein [Chloroflexi bacterium]|nr:histidine phosphatase family protein [Chloroflexota bacterium]